MDSSRNSAWVSGEEDGPPGQLAIDVLWLDSNGNQTFSIPMPGIPTHDIAKGLCSCLTQSTFAIGIADGAIRLREESSAHFPSVDDWITEIKRIWAHGPASTLELAKTVAAAKNGACHGQWQEIWKALPFSRWKADMLAAICRRLDWVNWQTFANLPVGWSILYELSKLKRPVFEEFVRLELIHSRLRLCEARELVAQLRGKAGGRKPPQARVDEWLRRFERFVGDTLHGWTAGEQELARTILTRLTKRIGKPSSLSFYLKTNESQFWFIGALQSEFSS